MVDPLLHWVTKSIDSRVVLPSTELYPSASVISSKNQLIYDNWSKLTNNRLPMPVEPTLERGTSKVLHSQRLGLTYKH